jgi:hypothetical protein
MRILALMLIVPAAVSAQEPAPKQLLAPTWTAAEGFSAIYGIRELSDGRVLLLDGRESRVVVLTRDGKSFTEVGRKGGGPGEYQSPFLMIAMPADTTAVFDQGLRRILFIGPDAKPGATMNLPVMIARQMGAVRASDSRGRFVLEFGRPPEEGAVEKSRPIVAWTRETMRLDTLASIKPVETYTVPVKNGAGEVVGTTGYSIRFAPADAWTVLSNGRVAVLHGEPYSLEIFGGREGPVRGAPIPYTRVDVAASERVPAVVADKMPAKKPAFWSGQAMAGPDADVWIARELPAGATTRLYDRFDLTASRTVSVTMERAIRIIGFGRGAMYTIRTDADGLQWLEKRPIPR